MDDPFLHAQDLPPVYEDALDQTDFALAQFRERADRDGTALVILSTHTMGTPGDLTFDRMAALAEPRGIPVIDFNDYVLRQGAEPRDARWEHDDHWNAAGHRWAAEALLEYLKENQAICTTRKRPTAPPPRPSLADGLRVRRVRRSAPSSTSMPARTRWPTSSRRAARRTCKRSSSCISSRKTWRTCRPTVGSTASAV